MRHPIRRSPAVMRHPIRRSPAAMRRSAAVMRQGGIRAPLAWAAAVVLIFAPAAARGAGPTAGPRWEIAHPGKGHEVHISPPALAVTAEGQPVVAWLAQAGHAAHVWVARPGPGETTAPVRVDPDGLAPESLHQSPGLAAGPGAAVYVTWASAKAKPAEVLFASDLQLARSLDGGRSFERPLRVNDDRPTSHSFEGIAVGADGAVLVAWIDARDGEGKPRSYLARVADRGSRLERAVKLDERETCVCCRLDVAGADGTVAALWRSVFPGDIRDMVLGVSRDGGRSFAPPARVSADGWKIAACPHRGGKVALDARARPHVAWYTEGGDETPRILYASTADGRTFERPRAIARAAGSVPDHVGLAVTRGGVVAVVWEESTPVRRRIRLRLSRDGGRTFEEAQALSTALKAFAPAIAAGPAGELVVAWHEEQFPAMKTVVQTLRAAR